jgi:tRNA(His) guanylyltransferase
MRVKEKGDALGDRMKGYERAAVARLPRRMPMIVRVDGKAFHTLTRECMKPFDERITTAMNQVAIYLCEEVQGAQLAYVQSDEVSVLVHNYKRLQTDAWFDNEVQKVASVAASIATAAFNEYGWSEAGRLETTPWHSPACFDARCFVLPEAEVCNYFVWRQQDATRNSVQMVARSLYSHAECHEKNNPELQDMIHAKGCNWDCFPTAQKRGRCVVPSVADGVRVRGWRVDSEIPVFTRDRSYVEKFLAVEPEGERDL